MLDGRCRGDDDCEEGKMVTAGNGMIETESAFNSGGKHW